MQHAADTPRGVNTATIAAPALLRALEHVLEAGAGWIARCPVWGCTELLTIEPDHHAGRWRLECDGEHTEQEIVEYLRCDTSLDQSYLRRLWRAVALAPTLGVCEALLRGQNVPRSALDALWARRLGA